jgi:LPXTG-motif cell wall-anchored protein
MKAFALALVGIFVFAVAAHADPGPSDEVVFTAGTCDSPTVLSAHNTQDKLLHYLIRIDSRLVEQGTLAVDARVRREYTQPNDSEHFYRIRLGLPVDKTYFSDEGWTRLHCSPTPPPTTTPPPPPTTTPPPPTTTPPPTTHTTTTPPPTTPPTTDPCRTDCHKHTADTGGSIGTPLAIGGVLLALGLGSFFLRRKFGAV